MAYQVLARKWRPKKFSDVIGQEATVRALQNSLISHKLHHAYLFTGTRGVGKTTIARILAGALVCEKGISADPCNACSICQSVIDSNSIDVIEIDAASKTKVEDTRAVLENLSYPPNIARFRIYIIDEVHMLSMHSFNALLKTLEEPPPHVKFLLATTDPQKLPITVLSRCLQFKLKMFTSHEISKHLVKILNQEGKSFEIQALKQIGLAANGSIRDSLSLLEQVLAFSENVKKITFSNTCKVLGIPDYLIILELLTTIIESKVDLTIKIINTLFESNTDPYLILQQMQFILKNITILQLSPQSLSKQDLLHKDLLLKLAKQASPDEIQLYYEIIIDGFKNLAFMPDIYIGFEMIMLKMFAFQPGNAIEIKQAREARVITGLDLNTDLENSSDNKIKINLNKPDNEQNKLNNLNTNNLNMLDVQDQQSIHREQDLNLDLKNSSDYKINLNKDNFTTVIKGLGLSKLTKQLAEHLVFDKLQQNQINCLIDDNMKSLVNQGSSTRLQKALGKYLNTTVKLKIKPKSFKQNPELQKQTIQWQNQSKQQEVIADNQGVKDLTEDFSGHVEDVIIK